jgi:signal transduction histidine kinase
MHGEGNIRMMPGYFKMMSLKTKMALAVTALFIMFIIAASYFTLDYFECSFKETISAQQFSLVTSLADNIDDKLRIAQNTLIAAAPHAPREVWSNADAAQHFLDSKIELLSIFDNGIFFISNEGELVAESPSRPDRRGKNLWFREWVQKTVTSGKPYISDPYISTHSPGQPAIVMTVPVFDSQGKIKGMMTGSLSLLGENFLSDLSKVKIGKTGYVFLADMNRILVVHPDKKRIMKPAAAPGVNKLIDRAFEGFEGSGETVTSFGVPMLVSIKKLGMASWFLGANYPKSEAYAPLEKAKRYFVIIGGPATAILLLITWFIMRRLMSPLAAMTRHVEHLSNRPDEDRLIEIDAMDEIGVLVREFNHMVSVMDMDRQSLEERVFKTVNELRQKDQLLIQQNRQAAMGEMIGNIAHQWRQPLNTLGLTIQQLLLLYDLGEFSRELLAQNVGSSMELIQHMSRTIDDFRNYFRPDKEKTEFKVHETIVNTLSLMEGCFQSPQIRIEVVAKNDSSIYGLQNEFAQVLLNILTNARDALIERKIDDPGVMITICREGGSTVVTVADNAGGIPEEILGKIFDPYFTTKGPQSGTGVGLFMSKTIIEKNMGGRLSALNIANGAEFRIEV